MEDKAIQMMRERAERDGYSENEEKTPEGENKEVVEQTPENKPDKEVEEKKEAPEQKKEGEQKESSLNTEEEKPKEEPKGEKPEGDSLVKELSEEDKPQQQYYAPSGEPGDDDVVEIETDSDMAKFISSHYGKEFTEEQIQRLVNGEKSKSETTYANDTVKEIDEYVRKGGSIEDYYNFKLTDFDSYSQEEQIAWKVKRDNPDLTDNEVSRLVNKKYQFNVDKEDLTDDEIQDLEIERKMAASGASKEFQKLQQEYSTPFQSKTQTPDNQKGGESEPEFTEEQVKQFQEAMEDSVNNLSEVKIGKYVYSVNDDLRNKVKQMPLDIGDLFVEDGEFNHNKYNQFRAIAADPKSYTEAMVEYGRTQALKEIKDKRNNVSLEPETQNADQNLQNPRESFRKLREAQRGGSSAMQMKF